MNLPKVKVKNMESHNGNIIPNQFIITTDDGVFFQSYSSMVAFKPFSPNEKTVLDGYFWDYSVTTGKYRNIFLGETKTETEKKIKSGKYILGNLNGV